MRKFITGDVELEKALQTLSDKAADKIAKAALRGGVSTLAKQMRKDAPVGETGALRASIGSRLEKGRGSKVKAMAKAGIAVGKQKKTAERMSGRMSAPHAHLVGLGTKARTRRTIGGKFSYLKSPTTAQRSTGIMPSNPFIGYASRAAESRVKNMMRMRAARALVKQAKLAAGMTQKSKKG